MDIQTIIIMRNKFLFAILFLSLAMSGQITPTPLGTPNQLTQPAGWFRPIKGLWVPKTADVIIPSGDDPTNMLRGNEGVLEIHNGTSWASVTSIKTVEQYGAVAGDGLDDTSAFQAAFDDLDEGDLLTCDCNGQSYNFTTTTGATFTKSNVTIDGGGCLIVENALSTATITGSGSNNSTIRNFRFTGSENLTNWQAGDLAYRSASRNFVRFLNCNNVLIEKIHGEGKRGNVMLQNCFYSTARYNSQLGFFGTFTSTTIPSISDPQYCRNVTATGGRYIRIENNSAIQTGAIATFSQNGFNQVVNNSGEYLHDNGIYNSSGAYNIISNNTIQWVAGAGIKTRGNSPSISTNKLRHVGVGIAFTGDGTTSIDSYNTNGRYGEITYNDISDVFTGSAISIVLQDGYQSRDTKVIGNTIFDHVPSDPTLSAIRVMNVKGLMLKNNIIHNSTADIAVNLIPDGTNVRENFLIDDNQFYLCKESLRMLYVDESIITNNTFKSCITGIYARYVNNNLFENNRSYDLTGAYGILLDPVYPCTNNRVFNNDNVSATTSNTLNTIIVDGTASGTRLTAEAASLTYDPKETGTGFQYYSSGAKSLLTGSATEIVLANGNKAAIGATVRSQVVGTDNGLSSLIVASTTSISNCLWQLQNQILLKATLAQTVNNGVTTSSPSQDAIYDFVQNAISNATASLFPYTITASTGLDLEGLNNYCQTYTHTGAAVTYTMPPIPGGAAITIKIVNAGSGNINLVTDAGGSDLWINGISNTGLTIAPGETTIFENNTLKWVKMN